MGVSKDMTRQMATEAESQRTEKRAAVVNAQAEVDIAKRLVEAAQDLDKVPGSMVLRYLQTMTNISYDKETTLLFPVPMDILDGLQTTPDEPSGPYALSPRGDIV